MRWGRYLFHMNNLAVSLWFLGSMEVERNNLYCFVTYIIYNELDPEKVSLLRYIDEDSRSIVITRAHSQVCGTGCLGRCCLVRCAAMALDAVKSTFPGESCLLLECLSNHLASVLCCTLDWMQIFLQNSAWRAACGDKLSDVPTSWSWLNDRDSLFYVLSSWIMLTMLSDCSFHIKETSFTRFLSKLVSGSCFMCLFERKEAKIAFVSCTACMISVTLS